MKYIDQKDRRMLRFSYSTQYEEAAFTKWMKKGILLE